MHRGSSRRPFRKKIPLKRKTHHPVALKPELDGDLYEVFSKIGRPPAAPFTPDPFQLEALKAIKRTDCLVMAPTGSGKTWIAEQAIRHVFAQGKRCWYASPLKALTNAKWVEFGDHFDPHNVGILTGDTKENADAPIIVGTTEILRNQLYDAMYEVRDLDCDLVILDEAHFLGDAERGVVWEEIMIYLPARINLLLLSATIENGREIAAWLGGLRRKECVVIEERKRPVPLFPLFLHPSGRILPFVEKKRLHRKVEPFIGEKNKKHLLSGKTPPYAEIMRVLRKYRLLPAIFFLQSRSACDAALSHFRGEPVPPDAAFQEDLRGLLERNPRLEPHRQLRALLTHRVGSHHGGQLPAWKFLIETMMKKGHLDAIFATSTVAAGVNFPARTIVLFNSDYYNGHECIPLDATAFHQMTGRAGRRGQDRIGFMLLVPGRFMDVLHVKRLLFSRPEDIESRIKNDFSMVLNLLLSQKLDDIRHIFENSLAAYQQAGKAKKGRENVEAELWRDFGRHLDFLKSEGFVDVDSRLTADGLWASKLRLDQPVLIAECLRGNALPLENEALLAAVIAPFVYDRGQDISVTRKLLAKKLVRACDEIFDCIRPVAKRLESAGFHVDPLPLWPAVVIYEWARGRDWDEIIGERGIADGDMAMLVSRTADNLRQIASLRDTHPRVAELASKAREAILREPVVFE